jgi:carboxylesterase type B
LRNRCFKDDEPELEEIVQVYSNTLFVYPAFRAARIRAEVGGAPTYLYQFAYEAERSLIKEAVNIDYKGAAHVEDQTYILKANSLLDETPSFPAVNRDDMMRDWMTMFLINFIKCE